MVIGITTGVGPLASGNRAARETLSESPRTLETTR